MAAVGEHVWARGQTTWAAAIETGSTGPAGR
jgi:hypothetical protein